MATDNNPDTIKVLFEQQSEDTQRAISETLKIEEDKKEHLRAMGAKEEIVAAIKGIVK